MQCLNLKVYVTSKSAEGGISLKMKYLYFSHESRSNLEVFGATSVINYITLKITPAEELKTAFHSKKEDENLVVTIHFL